MTKHNKTPVSQQDYMKGRQDQGLVYSGDWIPVESKPKFKRYCKNLRKQAGKPLPRDAR